LTFPHDRKSKSGGHILISGTGRAGTTLLVRYFTALGFDTGFSVNAPVDGIANAGLERIPKHGPLPYVAKSPFYGEMIDKIRVRCCIVPMRRLFDAAESRRRVYREAKKRGLNASTHPGSISTKDPAGEEVALAIRFHNLIEAFARHAIPTHFVHFPEFAESSGVLYTGLRLVLDEHGVSREESDVAHRATVDLGLIHKFGVRCE